MAIALAQGSSANGAATPAAPGSLTTTSGNLLILVVFVNGTSPTITTPGGWTLLQGINGASTSMAMYALPNNAGGATNPSVTLGGTVTGWAAGMWEFSGQGSNANYESLLGSFLQTQSNPVINIFANNAQMPQSNMLFVYAVGRTTATYTATNTGIAWSASQNAQSANGVALDFFWGTNPGPGPFPSALGTFSPSVVGRFIGAWFTSVLAQPVVPANVSGNAGYLVGSFYQGTIGG